MSNESKLNRRTLVKTAAVSLPLLASVGFAAKALAEAKPDLKIVSESDATAKALGYVADGKKATRPAKLGVEGKGQDCKGCQFYTKAGDVGGKEVGKCLMIPAGMVLADGWCKTWTKKS